MYNEDLEMNIKYKFKNPALLREALTHSSCCNKQAYKGHSSVKTGNSNPADKESHGIDEENFINEFENINNERLEFLGDAVLEAIISEYLFIKNNLDEGNLTKARALIVCEEALNLCAKKLALGKHIYMSSGEEKAGGREKKSILANAVEAIIGAVFVDGGFLEAKKLVLELFKERINDVLEGKVYSDYKSRLQEILQCEDKSGELPHYELIFEKGPDHDKTFHTVVKYKGKEIGHGVGHSKKESEQNAAKEALKLGGTDVF